MSRIVKVLKKIAKTTKHVVRPTKTDLPCDTGPPEDILRLIFETAYLSLNEEDRLRFTLLVTSICREWRLVAIHMPILWSTVRLKLVCRNTEPLRSLQTCLVRSDPLPLTIQLVSTISFASRLSGSSALNDAAEAIFLHRDRLCALSVTAPDVHSLQEDVLNRLDYDAPVLRSLSIVASGYHAPMTASGELLDLNLPSQFEAPNLQQLTIEPMSTSTLVRLPPIESVTLDFLRVYMDPNEIVPALQHVRFLHVHHRFWYSPSQVPSRLLFDRLERLTQAWGTEDLLRYMQAPLLTCVCTKLPNKTTWKIPQIENHLTHFPMLTTFEVIVDPEVLSSRVEDLSDAIDQMVQPPDIFRCVRLLGLDALRIAMILDRLGGTANDHNIGSDHDDPSHSANPAVSGVRIIAERAPFEPSALRKVVEIRHNELASSQGDEESVSVLDTLHVHTDLPISAEDRMWFEENLSYFWWAADFDD